MSETTIQPSAGERRDALVGRLFESLLGTLDLFAVYLGHTLGYYGALAERGSLTAGELADATGTHPRYCREWLEQQAVTGLLEVTADGTAEDRRFGLPPGHVEPLTDADSLHYMIWAPQLMAAFMRPLDALVTAYRTGGGVPWSAYGHDMVLGQAGQTRPMFLNLLATDWLPNVPGLAARLMSDPPARIAEIACGAGWAAIAMAKAYPHVRVDGYDLDAPSIEEAQAAAEAAGVADRVSFAARDAGAGDLDGQYDLVTVFEAIHDMPRPVEVLKTVRRLLAPNGIAMVADERVAETFYAPGDDIERAMYGFSLCHCLPVGMADPPSAGTGTVMRPDTLRNYAQQAGFRDIAILPIENDFWRFYQLVV